MNWFHMVFLNPNKMTNRIVCGAPARQANEPGVFIHRKQL
jgi:hypothetical protein